jgi:hypothetical protein
MVRASKECYHSEITVKQNLLINHENSDFDKRLNDHSFGKNFSPYVQAQEFEMVK